MADSKPYSWTPERKRAYYRENRERILAEKRRRYAEDKELRERTKERNRQERAANPDKHRRRWQETIANSHVMNRKAEIGACQRCGYDVCMSALDWHHLKPAEKCYKDLRRKPKDVVDAELAKCVLICANCHRELHVGLWSCEELATLTTGEAHDFPGAVATTTS